MAYHDDLLKHALGLLEKGPADAAQADLRRAISAAYYALFHLMISELVTFWSHADSKAALARMPQHRAMAEASRKIKQIPFSGEDAIAVRKLQYVAQTFNQLHEQREKADYDNTIHRAHSDALTEVALVVSAFSDWESIRDTRIAQSYVASMLVRNPKGG